MPLITAGFGLFTGVALIGSHHPRRRHVERRHAVGADDRSWRRDRLLAVHRHALSRELSGFGDVRAPSSMRWIPPGRAVLLAGATVVIALLGMFATGVAFLYGLAIAAVIAVLLYARRVADAAAGAAVPVRPPARAPARRSLGGFARARRAAVAERRGRAHRSRGPPAASADWRRWSESCRSSRGRWRSSRWR